MFLTMEGNPYSPGGLRELVKRTTYRYTGVNLHPHLIRTIWATEYLKKTGDLYRAAVMLNDKLETVVKNYPHLSERGVAEHVYLIMQDILDPLARPARTTAPASLLPS